ncbi:MAG TPA: PQQ-dependent sugar dehydrogenase, partial [Candidatus Baltobacteraceae bacterium]|nr:PQQ-dependent sugar dehydrogenase [Candidatus Baltobacteraceae bacterium]
MKNPLSLLAQIFCVAALFAISSPAQSFPKIQLQPIFPKLNAKSLVWMCQSPDDSGRFFIVEQDGIVVVLKKNSDGSDAKEFLNIVDRHVHFNREDGLLSIAFHPGYKTNGLIYAYYTMENKPGNKQPDAGALADKAIAAEYPDIKKLNNGLPVAFPYRSVISEFKVSATDPDKVDMSSERVIFEVLQPFWNHKGALLQFGPDGYLYFGLGDGGRGNDPFGNAQNTTSLLGKMLRI